MKRFVVDLHIRTDQQSPDTCLIYGLMLLRDGTDQLKSFGVTAPNGVLIVNSPVSGMIFSRNKISLGTGNRLYSDTECNWDQARALFDAVAWLNTEADQDQFFLIDD